MTEYVYIESCLQQYILNYFGKETTDVTGLVLTKLDGTAKGGIVLAIRIELHLPVMIVLIVVVHVIYVI